MSKLSQLRDDGSYWPYLLLAAALLLVVMLAQRIPWWQVVIVVGVGWFVLDQASRIYLMNSPMETYKNDQTESDAPNAYRMEKEREAEALLESSRVGRWLLKGKEK